MLLRILAVGDVVSEAGLAYLERRLRRLQREHNVDFTVVNGENAAGIGLLPRQAEAILDSGADVVTLGNHTWGKTARSHDYLDDCRACVLRPGQLRSRRLPGRRLRRVRRVARGLRVGVDATSSAGSSMDPNADNPFTAGGRRSWSSWLRRVPTSCSWISTPRPPARSWPLGWYLDGRVSAPSGAPTPMSPRRMVRFLPKGTGHHHRPGYDRACQLGAGHPSSGTVHQHLSRRPSPVAMKRRMAPVSWRARCSPLTRTQGTV